VGAGTLLAPAAKSLQAGQALDLGAGEGGDSAWLDERGGPSPRLRRPHRGSPAEDRTHQDKQVFAVLRHPECAEGKQQLLLFHRLATRVHDDGRATAGDHGVREERSAGILRAVRRPVPTQIGDNQVIGAGAQLLDCLRGGTTLSKNCAIRARQ
jgi:hypothetical protein